MGAKRQLTGFEKGKRLLVFEADLHRALLRAECASIGARLNWVKNARDQARSASPWLAVGAAAVGILVASRWHSFARWIPTALATLRWVKSLKAC